MTHGKILQHGTRAKDKRCLGSDEAQRVFIPCRGSTGKAIQHLQAPSLSLRARSGVDWEADSGSRKEGSLHSQTLSGVDPSTSSICTFHGEDVKRDRNPGAGSFSARRSEAWLRGENAFERSSWNTALTGCQRKRRRRLIGCWFRRRLGKPVTPTQLLRNKLQEL